MTLPPSTITYRYGSPSMPMVILAASSITIKSDFSVTLWYEFGRNDPPVVGTQTSALNPQQYQALMDALTQAGLFTMPWPPSMPMVGGSQESVTVTDANAETFTISSNLAEEARQRFEAIVQAIRAAVPANASAAMARDQAAYLQHPAASQQEPPIR